MKTLNGIDELYAVANTRFGYSSWHTLTQEKIDTFADATGDHQWIHVDPSRAADGPFGATIAHGHLLASMIPMLVWEVYAVDGVRMGINYGSNKVRFPAPVPVGSRIRAAVDITDVETVPSGVQVVTAVTIERENADKPVCVAEIVSIYVPK
ncbi:MULTISPECIES: MaoC family dehydratase [unclassified Rhodococcus (in: high G+C Gram-positive bacteria)]|uniref:MaoC family dehydratase n=1 Tax=unclassified Rhodococcus (in: high G+C Gram-positive bacteria) TaxID=192944 RepID=UPI00163A666F|nr:MULTISPECIES: MaoC family dehydratase [unclassified Rhodococcus (in: high G+C Gram-positive bacteria)]MBC2641909.1 MaoC family dehydratase [Rhodococcus sp. 3A]MBC2893349.1 MaoC family dehydratase [Rhodococcus sp. 4CII]